VTTLTADYFYPQRGLWLWYCGIWTVY